MNLAIAVSNNPRGSKYYFDPECLSISAYDVATNYRFKTVNALLTGMAKWSVDESVPVRAVVNSFLSKIANMNPGGLEQLVSLTATVAFATYELGQAMSFYENFIKKFEADVAAKSTELLPLEEVLTLVSKTDKAITGKWLGAAKLLQGNPIGIVPVDRSHPYAFEPADPFLAQDSRNIFKIIRGCGEEVFWPNWSIEQTNPTIEAAKIKEINEHPLTKAADRVFYGVYKFNKADPHKTKSGNPTWAAFSAERFRDLKSQYGNSLIPSNQLDDFYDETVFEYARLYPKDSLLTDLKVAGTIATILTLPSVIAGGWKIIASTVSTLKTQGLRGSLTFLTSHFTKKTIKNLVKVNTYGAVLKEILGEEVYSELTKIGPHKLLKKSDKITAATKK